MDKARGRSPEKFAALFEQIKHCKLETIKALVPSATNPQRLLVIDKGRLRLWNLPAPPNAKPATAEKLPRRLGGAERELTREESLRSIEAGMARRDRLAAAHEQRKTVKVIILLSRSFCEGLGNFRRPDDYAGMCYYSFPKGRHGYEGQVSLEFGNGGDQFQVQMYEGQGSGMKDLGQADYDDVKAVPKDVSRQSGDRFKAVVGHVYAEHHLETKDEDLGVFKFEVLDLHPGRWVILAWERIPLAKDEKARR
jgi:hypothetical protein